MDSAKINRLFEGARFVPIATIIEFVRILIVIYGSCS